VHLASGVGGPELGPVGPGARIGDARDRHGFPPLPVAVPADTVGVDPGCPRPGGTRRQASPGLMDPEWLVPRLLAVRGLTGGGAGTAGAGTRARTRIEPRRWARRWMPRPGGRSGSWPIFSPCKANQGRTVIMRLYPALLGGVACLVVPSTGPASADELDLVARATIRACSTNQVLVHDQGSCCASDGRSWHW
jgi:hypothetical protein